MNSTNTKDKRTPYTALIRWRGPDPSVELETQFRGFDSIRNAARFAGSTLRSSPHGLRLSENRIELLLGDGQLVNFPYDSITAWILTPPELIGQSTEATSPSSFQVHSLSALAALRKSHGNYRRTWYAVLGPNGTRVHVPTEACNITPVIPEGR